jgi:acetate---CoA ligase (ADP-forming)
VSVDQARLQRTLNPRSIVVIGDKAPNYGWLQRQSEFKGPVYSVQVDPREIEAIERLGFTNYLSLDDVPGDIDLAICAVPRQIAPRIVAAAAQRGVGGMAMFTSGFAETGEPEAIELQRQIVEISTQSGMPIVGPNCLGIYNRRLGVKFGDDQEAGEGGVVSIAGQSGTNTSGLVSTLQRLNVPVARAISFGNASVVNEADYLEYFADDPDTQVVLMYIEGVRDGRRFFDVLRRITAHKPVVIWRGGRSEAGARAVASHTASLASSSAVWEALLQQTGAIGVGSLDDAVDVAAALVHTDRPNKRGIALIGMNGGQSVALTDQFSEYGFDVPQLSSRSYKRLSEFFMTVGGSYRNPFDAASTIRREDDNLQRILEVIEEDRAIDGGVAIELGARDLDKDPAEMDRILDLLDGYRKRTGEPVVALMHDNGGGAGGVEAMVRARRYVADRGFAVFPSYERGAAALGRVVTYYERLGSSSRRRA